MNFEKLILDNFLTVGHAEFDLANRGLLLIQGVNNDDTSASSNGAGKSSCVDGLCWVLFGTTARDESGDDVINEAAGKNCQGAALLNDNGVRYRIERNRKNGPKKNQLFIHRLEVTGDVDMSKGTEKETQEVVNKVLGSSYEVFCASVYAGQEKMPDLPGMTDKQLKLLIEEAAGVEVLAAAHKLALGKQLAAKGALEIANVQLTNASRRCESAKQALSDAKTAHKDHADGRLDRAKAKMADAGPHLEGIKGWQEELSKFDEDAALALRDEGAKELCEIQPMLDKQKELEAASARISSTIAGLSGHIAANKRTLAAKKSELENMQALVGTPCNSCGKEYCEHDMAAAVTAKKASFNELAAQTRDLVSQQAERQAELDKATAEADAHRAGIPDVKAANDKQERGRILLTAISGLRTKIENARTEVERIKAEAQTIARDTTNPYDAILTKAQGDEANALHDESAAETGVVCAQDALELAQDLVAVYGPAGVRAHILDTVTPFLNERTREYLGALSDGNIHATWSTLTKNAKGELKEKFQIVVENDKGSKRFKGQSGGEKRKVRLACALALQDMVASRATKPLNIFVGDEIDHALDEPGLERLMGVLERKARDRGTVLVISHNALGDWIDQVITVTKSGGQSVVTGDNVARA